MKKPATPGGRAFWLAPAFTLLLANNGQCFGGGDRPAPIPVPCVTQDQIPAEIPPLGELPEDARQAADTLGALDLMLRANERIMRALLRGCTS